MYFKDSQIWELNCGSQGSWRFAKNKYAVDEKDISANHDPGFAIRDMIEAPRIRRIELSHANVLIEITTIVA